MFTSATLSLALAHIVIAIPPFNFPSPVDSGPAVDNGQALANIATQGNFALATHRLNHPTRNGCNMGNTAVRQEFRKMSLTMRRHFTQAVECLMSRPSNMGRDGAYPGVLSRYDDWAAAHIEFDPSIHFTGQFLHWHRYAIWTFEQDLRSLCGYSGYLPYWDWGLDAEAPQNSEVFNGDRYSMGSNGAYVPNDQPLQFSVPLPSSYLETLPNPQTSVTIPPGSGTGGGCISPTGPFGGDSIVHLGPTLLGFYGTPAKGIGNNETFAYSPRCIKRDINPYIMQKFASYRNITQLITNYTSIEEFQRVMQSDSRSRSTVGNVGVHAGGHIGIGGDPMADQPSTPGDPMWFLHHAQIDRIWSIWQNQDLTSRLDTVADTHTILNYPASSPMTLDDAVDLHYVGLTAGGAGGRQSPPSTIKGLSRTWDGPFCYIYQ